MLGMLGLYIATFISATLNFLIVGMFVFILDRYIFCLKSRMLYAWVYLGCLIIAMMGYVLNREEVLRILAKC